MGTISSVHEAIDQAKQHRAEMIGSTFRSAAIPLVLAAVLSLVLVQLNAEPAPEATSGDKLAQIISTDR